MRTRHPSRWRAIWWGAASVVIVYGPAGAFQAPGRPEPRLPGAVTKPPEWVGADAPFDVKAFFAAPPPEQNAAPLYLDALFEFGPELAVCFPADAETARRRAVVQQRARTLDSLYQTYAEKPDTLDGEAVDRLVAELEPALRRVELAQGRPRCVFESGVDISSLLPHALASRQAARLVLLKTHRRVARGDVEVPLQDLEIVLRLARDLRPRAGVISQITATAITCTATSQIIPELLASPSFGDGHARRLLDLLVRHEAASIDGYQQGLRYEYLILRKMLVEVEKEPRKVGKAFAVADPAFGKESGDAAEFGRLFERELRSKPDRARALNARMDDYYRDALAFNGPLARWPARQLDPGRIHDGSNYSRFLAVLLSPVWPLAETRARAELAPRAAECLVALKLWKMHSTKPPTDLEAVVKAAGLPGVPIDPYSGKPLRMAIIDGEPVIYSIGKDGRDDGGRVDSNSDRKSGDQTFRLPAVAKPKP